MKSVKLEKPVAYVCPSVWSSGEGSELRDIQTLNVQETQQLKFMSLMYWETKNSCAVCFENGKGFGEAYKWTEGFTTAS